MPARWFWASYLVLAFAVIPSLFRCRYGRWPYAYPLRRADAYLWTDLAFGALTIGLAFYLFLADPRSGSAAAHRAGLALGLIAIAIMIRAILSLGPAWRIGQDRSETHLARIATGPYRVLRHPIYLGLILLAIAIVMMAGATIYTSLFALATIAYSLIQAHREDRRWAATAPAYPLSRE